MYGCKKQLNNTYLNGPVFKARQADALLYWGMVKSIRLNKAVYARVIISLQFWEDKLLPSEWLKIKIIELKNLNEELKPDGTGK